MPGGAPIASAAASSAAAMAAALPPTVAVRFELVDSWGAVDMVEGAIPYKKASFQED
eukprot:CAMPEP_0183457766 /NCGR_PEP_ID=MMETSP0370-20130417/132053_1 /TAXON_ID=268820 /ORGANISM="Peridinium aciculiferum, Strain PAER-2" /LENGTH=56 /DNA_ID=CAMNT_0025649499 /DNA_START=33 /DNA_END=203 /DNA_ORIENTATION=-